MILSIVLFSQKSGEKKKDDLGDVAKLKEKEDNHAEIRVKKKSKISFFHQMKFRNQRRNSFWYKYRKKKKSGLGLGKKASALEKDKKCLKARVEIKQIGKKKWGWWKKKKVSQNEVKKSKIMFNKQ